MMRDVRLRVLLHVCAAMLVAATAHADEPEPPAESGPPRAPAPPAPAPPAAPAPSVTREPPVIVTGPPPPVAAPPEAAPDVPVKDTRKDGAFEVSVSGTTFAASLDDVRFRGQGVLRGSTARIDFDQPGSDLGVSSPRFWGGELRAAYLRRYLAVGLSGFVAANAGGADATPARPDLAALVSPSGLFVFGGAVNAYGALPLGRITARLGADLGIRAFTMPLSGFDPAVCTSNSRRTGRVMYLCSENARTSAVPFLHPQLRIDVAVSRSQQLFIGSSLGFDALGGSGVMASILFGFRTAAHENLRP